MTMPGPLPRRTRDSDPFWDACGSHRLVVQRCTACAATRYPPMPGCPACSSMGVAWEELAPRGTVVRSTVVHARVHPAFDPPYALVVVAIDNGPMIMSCLAGGATSAPYGLRVRGVWQDEADAATALLLFEPDDA